MFFFETSTQNLEEAWDFFMVEPEPVEDVDKLEDDGKNLVFDFFEKLLKYEKLIKLVQILASNINLPLENFWYRSSDFLYIWIGIHSKKITNYLSNNLLNEDWL